MALQKQPVSINFSQGLDTKTDPWQVQTGKMLALNNTIFDKGGLLQKRNGFQPLESLPVTTSTTLTTFLDNLIALGTEFNVRSNDTSAWYNRGLFQPMDLTVIPTVRASEGLTTADTTVASNLLACSVYTNTNSDCFYQINDSNTGQVIIPITSLPSGSHSPRVFSLDKFFIITFVVNVSASPHLRYISIPISTPNVPSAPTDLSTTIKSLTAAYDGFVYDNVLYFAYNASDIGGAIRVAFLNSNFSVSGATVIASHTADLMSVTVDSSGSNLTIWVSFWDANSTNAYAVALSQFLSVVLAATQVLSSVDLIAITSCAVNQILTFIYQTKNTYTYSTIRSDYVSQITCTQTGTVGTPGIIARSIGLASKSFYRKSNNTIYFLGVYGGSLQSTYFLMDQNGNVIAKLAYSNSYGYVTSQILPSVTFDQTIVQIGYLYKSTLVSVNKIQGLSNATGIYAQSGMNLVSFSFEDVALVTSEIGNNLHITGGYLWMYDGAKPVEHNFHLWPEDLGSTTSLSGGGMSAQQYFYQATYEWTDAQGNLHRSAPSVPFEVDLSSLKSTATFTGIFTSGSTTMKVNSVVGLNVGQILTDSTTSGNLAAGTTITAINPLTNTITLSLATLGASATTTQSFGANFTSGIFNLGTTSNTGLSIGQTVTDVTTPSNITAGTTITALFGSPAIQISKPTAGASAGGSGDSMLATTFVGDSISANPPSLQFKSIFPSGANTIVVNSLTGLHVGQKITDVTTGANITANTTITAIDSASNTLTLSLPTAGASTTTPGDTLQTIDTLSVTINVPTLRLTYKVGTNPLRIVLYRWSAGQQIYYQDTLIQTPVLNNPAVDFVSIVDSYSDAEILGNIILYTTGGVIENIAAPSCSTMTLYKSRLILLDSEDRNLLWYSKQVIESTPVEMSDLFTLYVAPTISAQGSTGPITALSAMDDKLIIFKENAIYYLTGTGPDNTGTHNDFTDPVFITSTVGCTNQQSIVFMPQGLMFQSNKGIWLLGRDLSTTYIGAPVEAYNGALVQSAVNIPATNQVRFTLDTGVTLMFDYFYAQWGTFSGIPSISSTIYQDLHTYINSFGQVYQEDPGVYLDGSNPVLMSFTTSWFNLAGLQGYERAYFFYLLGKYITPHKLNVQIAYDYNPYPTQQSLILPQNFSPLYGNDALYGSGSPYGGSSKVEQWRIFLQTQKCQSFQITITEIYDPSYGIAAGAGLTISGLDLIVGMKSGYPRLKAAVSIG